MIALLRSLFERVTPDHRRRLLAQRYGGSYLPVVVGLFVAYMAVAVASFETLFWTMVLTAFLGLLIPLAVVGTDFQMRMVYSAIVGASAAFGLILLGELTEIALIQSSGRLLMTALFLAAQLLVLADVLRQHDVTVDTILGGVAAYLFFGLIWAYIYLVVLRYQPDALSGPIGEPGQYLPSMLYFSVVTQTTLGYGDIQPVSGLARGLVQLEAIVGQLYIAVFVAWIVGQFISSVSERRAEAARDQVENG